MSAKLVRVALSEDEARSIEFMLEDAIRHLKQRNAVMHSPAADALIDRYLGVIVKVRTARGLENPNPKRSARDGYRTPARADA